MDRVTDVNAHTPIMKMGEHNWAKRDDLFHCNGAWGGKCRSACKILQGKTKVVTYGSRISVQGVYTPSVAQKMNVECTYVTASGSFTPEMTYAKKMGTNVIQVKPGYLSQCRAHAKKIEKELGYYFIPLSMESKIAVDATRAQVPSEFPAGVKRIVITIGAGVSAAGVLWGLQDHGIDIPVLGVSIGRKPKKLLDRWCPPGWDWKMELVFAPQQYKEKVANEWNGIYLDPHYEAKCLQYTQPGDLLWIIGTRPGVGHWEIQS